MRIIYKKPEDAVEFDYDRYIQSLKRYGEIDEVALKNALKELHYDPMHYSVLIELGIQSFKNDNDAEKYYKDHTLEEHRAFERLRRITGYLVGSLERWNEGKQAEEKARVKHSVTGVYTPSEKKLREFEKGQELLEQQDEYHKGTCADC